MRRRVELFITLAGGLVGLLVVFNQPLLDWLVGAYRGIPWWVGLIILGALLLQVIFRASYRLWKEAERGREALERENERLKRELLQKFLGKIEEWVLDTGDPLTNADLQDPRRLVARTEALATLETQGPSGKRRLLETIWSGG